ncbi:hypothetical protein [Flavobacterium sp. PL12]|uniref:hypothetical protein n=1 Tax=Flavobacterium sp. PL12 TaxID=3071718 RepID=UPI00319EB82A
MTEIELEGNIKLIGSGGVSKVYEGKINNISKTKLVILKIGCNAKENFRNYTLIKTLQLPTLHFLKKGLYQGRSIIITEHLNLNSDFIYVTPNSLISDSTKLLRELSAFKHAEKPDSIAEQFRYNYKLKEITNFEEFILSTVEDLNKAAESKIVIDFDSYFIGSLKNEFKSSINYKIADFDHIYKCNKNTYEECFEGNKSEFARVMYQFLKYFVEEGNNKDSYNIIIDQINENDNLV